MSQAQNQEDVLETLQSWQPEGILSEQSFRQYERYYGKWPNTDNEPTEPNYWFPIDEEEQHRLDLWHKFMVTIRDERLYQYEPPKCIGTPKILDLGTGTGIWANDVAQRLRAQNTAAQIMAVDLNRIQAKTVPEDVVVLQADLEDATWEGLKGTGVIDGIVMTGGKQALYRNCHLIHLGSLLGSIRSDAWAGLYKRVADALDPGYGYMEQVEIDWVPKWRNNEAPEGGCALWQWSEHFIKAMQTANRSVQVSSEQRKRLMREAGLIYIEEKIIRCPVSPWNGEKENTVEYEKVKWFNLAFTRSLPALSRWPMIAHYLAAGTNMKGEKFDGSMSRLEREETLLAELAELNKAAETQSMNTAFPAYYNVHIWVAKKPGP